MIPAMFWVANNLNEGFSSAVLASGGIDEMEGTEFDTNQI